MYDPQLNITIREETGRIRVQTLNIEPTLTQQQFKDECDINNIIKRYEATGEIQHLNRRVGIYGDFSDIPDYQEMLARLQSAQEAFLTLDPQIRQRFRNDPGQLISFLQDPKNKDEAMRLGLLDPSKQQQQQQTQTQTQNQPTIPNAPNLNQTATPNDKTI